MWARMPLMATVGGRRCECKCANMQKCGGGGGGSGHGEAMRGLGKHTTRSRPQAASRKPPAASHIYLRRLIQRPESPLAPARRGCEPFASTIVTTCTRALRHKANCRQDTHVGITPILRHLHKQARTALHGFRLASYSPRDCNR
jgi:hypothetical protein